MKWFTAGERAMTIEQLRHAHQAQPFQPFSLHLADGKQLDVPHREFLSHSESGRTVIVHERGEAWNVVDLLLVTRLEFSPARAAGQNGGPNES
jgi:hypothetical protein